MQSNFATFRQMIRPAPISALEGETIHAIFMSEDRLAFQVTQNPDKYLVYTVDADCCSDSVFYDFFGVSEILGKKVIHFEVIPESEHGRDLQQGETDHKRYQEAVTLYGFRIEVETGFAATFSFRNYSNGYYGGMLKEPWYTELRPTDPEVLTDVPETLPATNLS